MKNMKIIFAGFIFLTSMQVFASGKKGYNEVEYLEGQPDVPFNDVLDEAFPLPVLENEEIKENKPDVVASMPEYYKTKWNNRCGYYYTSGREFYDRTSNYKICLRTDLLSVSYNTAVGNNCEDGFISGREFYEKKASNYKVCIEITGK